MKGAFQKPTIVCENNGILHTWLTVSAIVATDPNGDDRLAITQNKDHDLRCIGQGGNNAAPTMLMTRSLQNQIDIV